jgi:hypothetical protein
MGEETTLLDEATHLTWDRRVYGLSFVLLYIRECNAVDNIEGNMTGLSLPESAVMLLG